MKFSIIIPAHNAASTIGKTLESVRSQEFKDYELLVVCDSCDDNTEEIAKSYGATTVSVDYARDGLTRNKGIEMATGDWVLFMDADDWWMHEYVLTMLNAVLDNDVEDILCFSFIWKGIGYVNQLKQLLPAVWNKVWYRDFIKDVKFTDKPYGSDADFTQAVFDKKPRIKIWDMPFYYYNFMAKGSLNERKEQGEFVDYGFMPTNQG